MAQHTNLVPHDDTASGCKDSGVPSPPPMRLGPNGFTLDLCRNDEMCQGDRKCMTLSSNLRNECPGPWEDCRCFPRDGKTTPCNETQECEAGEICGTAPFAPSVVCMSASVHDTLGPRYSRQFGTRPPPFVENEGLSGVQCTFDKECQTPRRCTLPSDKTFGECAGRDGCICKQVFNVSCGKNEDCQEGELCFREKDSSVFPYCWERSVGLNNDELMPVEAVPTASTSAGPGSTDSGSEGGENDSSDDENDASGSNEPEDVCIGEEHLKGIKAEDLVFRKSQRGSLLCDTHGSCATAGHMVEWKGTVMMMWTYCRLDNVQCVRRVGGVNSLRMKRQLRVASFTDGLMFTALAAKYQTRLEEVVLTTLLSVGM